MNEVFEFTFNSRKAYQSIALFIFSSFILLTLLLITENEFSEGVFGRNFFVWFILFFYLVCVIYLAKRLYIAHFRASPKIKFTDDYLIVPSLYLGKKKIRVNDIYSVEIFPTKSKNEVLILGIKNGGRYLIDEIIFSNKYDFKIFKKYLKKIVEGNKSDISCRSIAAISESQEKRTAFFTVIFSIVLISIYTISTSARLEIPENSEFVLLGAATKNIVETGEFYRIFSSIFLHLNVFHLLLNLLVFGVMGELIEKVISTRRFINIFFVSGFFAYFGFLFFSGFPMGIGASGCIYGLWGAYFSLKLQHEKLLPGSVNAVSLNRLIFILASEFLMEIFLFDNVSYEVHIIGFLTGFIYLYLVPLGRKLETVDQLTKVENGLFTVLVSSYSIGLSYFLLLYYGLI